MTSALSAFLSAHPTLALIRVVEAKGSTPREQGAWMLVAPETIFGTIGGGQLEFMAIDRARAMLAKPAGGWAPLPPLDGEGADPGLDPGEASGVNDPASLPPVRRATSPVGGEEGTSLPSVSLSVPLGPEIGQCCGGRVELAISLLDEHAKNDLLRQADNEDATRPHVYLFGGGHVGHALAEALALLPVSVTVVETRAEALEGLHPGAKQKLTAVPEEEVRAAPPGSAFVVLTHDHALDFLIVAEALARKDAAYVGMIGSQTKKATFRSWYLKTAGGTEADFARLVSPIGGSTLRDKRPAVIAALAAAEIMTLLAPG